MNYTYTELQDEISRQDVKYGRSFAAESPVGKVRLGIACLEDEVEECREAWRAERRLMHLPVLYADTRAEAVQVAALAMRLVRQIDEIRATAADDVDE